MKKIITIIVLSIFTFSIASCNSDDDNSGTENTLSGTAWFGTDNDEGEVYTFTTDSDFTFSGDGSTQNGTYTYNGSSGLLSHTDDNFDFTVSGDVLTVDNGDMSIYVKQ